MSAITATSASPSQFDCLMNYYNEKTDISLIAESQNPKPNQLNFCYLTAEKTLNSLIGFEYTSFDAKTTSNCCHGISLLARRLINDTKDLDLESMRTGIRAQLTSSKPLEPKYQIPFAIYQLSQMFLLSHIREITSEHGGRSVYGKLRTIEPGLSNHFCTDLGQKLQKKYSNLVANSYQDRFHEVPEEISTNNVPLKFWAKYVTAPYLRKDIKGIMYAPCMFSMQVCLGYLISKKAKIAVLNTISDLAGTPVQQYIKVLEGNGRDNFHTSSADEVKPNEPIIVFGGTSNTSNPSDVVGRMEDMTKNFASLVLACDIHYPQFPNPVFNNDPIEPQEDLVSKTIEAQKTIKGVSAKDSSFFCLTHIYLWSAQQVQKILKDNTDIAAYKIPRILQS